jgi:hypothetical protein
MQEDAHDLALSCRDATQVRPGIQRSALDGILDLAYLPLDTSAQIGKGADPTHRFDFFRRCVAD